MVSASFAYFVLRSFVLAQNPGVCVLVSLRVSTVSIAFVTLLGSRGSAQRPACPRTESEVARPCEIDQWPLADRQRLRPSYPDILRQDGVSGEVLLRYVVDTNGRASVASMEVLRSSHAYFATSVRNAMPRQRFEPARRAGVLTSVAVEELVTFTHPGPGWRSARYQQLTSHAVDSTGRLLTFVHAFTPRDSTKAPLLAPSDSVEILEALFDEILETTDSKKPPSAWCLQLAGRVPTVEFLARWRGNDRRVVAPSDCPHTYTTMIRTPANRDPPRGWVDPVHVTVDSLMSWAEHTVILSTQIWQGTAFATHTCEMVREAGKWRAFCVTTKRGFS